MKIVTINNFKSRGHCIAKEELSMACARQAMADLIELGFSVSSFRLGLRASITVQPPIHCNAVKPLSTAHSKQRVILEFVPVAIGFNGAFHYTTYGAVFGQFLVEWHKRRFITGEPQ